MLQRARVWWWWAAEGRSQAAWEQGKRQRCMLAMLALHCAVLGMACYGMLVTPAKHVGICDSQLVKQERLAICSCVRRLVCMDRAEAAALGCSLMGMLCGYVEQGAPTASRPHPSSAAVMRRD